MFAKILFFVFLHSSTAIIHKLNDSDYARMPPLFHLDNYMECFNKPEAIYCGAQLLLVSDEPSELLTMIQEYAAYPTHYNRTLLRHGYCMNQSCKQFYNNSGEDLRLSLEACMNESLYTEYKLKTKVLDNIDCSKRNREQPIEFWDVFVALTLLGILWANLVGSLCDHYLKNKDYGAICNLCIRYMCCFSIIRNWKKFIASPGESGDTRLKALKGIHGFRGLTMCLVIIAHAGFISIIHNLNPKFIEDRYENKLYHIFVNGTLVMQTFLVISSFLLVYNWLIYLETHAFSWIMLPQHIIMRWLRLTPPYALILGLTVTWLGRLGSGPYWKTIVFKEISDCRREWWKHLLYINNYSSSSQCLGHTWYLAADTQLYIMGVIVFMICRTGLTRKVVLSLLFVAGMIIPALHIYYQRLNGILVVNPEMIMTLFTEDPTFEHVFIKGHTNLIGYVIGMSLGYMIYYWQQAGGDPKRFRKYRYLYWSLFLWGVLCSFSGTIFYQGQQQPVYIHLLYGAFLKPVFAILIAAGLSGVIIQFEGLYRPVLEWQPFMYMSRLSYSAYLLHSAFVIFEAASIKSLQRVSEMSMMLQNITIVMTTFITAFFLWMLVEAPTGNLIREFFGKSSKHTKEDNKEPVEESKNTEDDKETEMKQTSKEDGAIVITMGSTK